MNWTVGVSFIFTFLLIHARAEDTANNELEAKPFDLPNNLWPEWYNVLITVNLEENDFSFYGFSEITVKCLKNTNTIIVNVKDLKIDATAVTVKVEETVLKIVNQQEDKNNQLYFITMEQELTKDTFAIVHIPFQGVVEEKLSGLYRSSYINPDTNKISWVALTQAEPNFLRSVFPCMDDLKFKSKYNLSIGHHKRFTALSNTLIAQTSNIDDKPDYVLDTFKSTIPLSSYLVGFVIMDFEKREMNPPNSSFPISVWARKGTLEMTQLVHEVTARSFEFWTNYFGIKLDLEKLDLVVFPDFAMGGMENSGLTTGGEWDMLYQEGVSTPYNKVNTAKLSAHEMVHSWMGNMASFKDWRSDWVKEGFANFLEKVAVSNLYDDLKILETEWALTFMDALSADGLLGSRKLAYNPQNVIEPSFIFDTITYKKGSILIRMLSFVMGDDLFKTAVSTFIQTFKDKSAEMEDVWQIFTDTVKNTDVFLPPNACVGVVMKPWTEQRGYPKLKVTRDVQNKKVIIEQTPFDFNAEKESDKRQWLVPISCITKKAPKVESVAPKYWLGYDGPLEITDIDFGNEDWLMINPRMTSLCRVLYDPATLDLISKTLTNEKTYMEIDLLSRVQFLTDLQGLAWTGDIEYSVLFEGLKLMWHDTEYTVWAAGLAIIGSLRYVLSLTDLGVEVMNFGKTIIEPGYLKDPNINEFNGDINYIRKKALFVTWVMGFGPGDCRKQAVDLFNAWMREKNPDINNPIAAPARMGVYCWASVVGGQIAFDFLYQRLQNTIVPAERVAIIDAFGCTQENKIINTLLEWSIDRTKFRQIESLEIFWALSTDDIATNSLFDFFMNKFDAIFDFHKGNLVTLGKYISYLFGRVSTEERFKKFTDFLETKKDKLQGADIAIQLGISLAKDNMLFIKRHYDYLKKYLAQFNTTSG